MRSTQTKNLFLALGVIHIVFSTISIPFCFFTIKHLIGVLKNPDGYGSGYIRALYNVHLSVLLCPFSFISACFFLAKKRIGWVGTIVSIFCNAVVLIAMLIFGLHFMHDLEFMLLSIPLVFLIVELSCFILLWNNKNRQAFKVNTNTVMITSVLLFLLLCDGVWGYLNIF